jgi:hypothetical protein
MKTLAMMLAACALLAGCAMDATMIRNAYIKDRIAFPSTQDNFQLFGDSSLKSCLYYKTSLQSDFDISYFYSLYDNFFSSYPVMFAYYDSIISSRLLPGENFVTLGNLFSDYLVEKDGDTYLTFYRIDKNRLILKKIVLVMTLSRSLLLAPGTHRSDGSEDSIHVELKARNGKVLYSSGLDEQCFVQLDTQEVKDGVLSAALSADLRSTSDSRRYRIREGALWLKL